MIFRCSKPVSLRFTRAVCALALAFTVGMTMHAKAADEEEEDSIETKIMKAILGINDGDSIDYRERSPLVVPQGRDLPPPETTAAVADPAWPKDPSKQPKKKNTGPRKSAEEEARPLSPQELEIGRNARVRRQDTSGDDKGRPLSPAELGYKGGFLGTLFKGKEDEVATYPGEPARTSLTAPPTGYLTPSAAQPYGLTARKEAAKPYNYLENKGTQ